MGERFASSPVLLLAFNRPGLTRRVLEQIAAARVGRLYIALDGPRADRAGEADRCAEVAALVDQTAWAEEIVIRRREANLGCKNAVVDALDWFFGHEPEGVVLEDDCLPGEDFLPFCDSMLGRYREDERVWDVSGDNLLHSWRPTRSDYFFSHGSIWGWASWRRSWKRRDIAMATWADPEARARARSLLGPLGWRYLANGYAEVAAGRIDTWDFQWSWTRASNEGLSVVPARNLVTNIGFGPDATHTSSGSRLANMPTGRVTFPLRAPKEIAFDRGYQFRVIAHELARFRAGRLAGRLPVRPRAR